MRLMPMSARALRRAVDATAVQDAIARAELRSSGEIRVSVSHIFWGDARAMAALAFERLGLRATAERNGVLIFVVPSRRRFVVLGDEGVHALAGQELWDRAAAVLAARFSTGDFTGGLVEAITAVGDALAAHFPRRHPDLNELPDDVDFGA